MKGIWILFWDSKVKFLKGLWILFWELVTTVRVGAGINCSVECGEINVDVEDSSQSTDKRGSTKALGECAGATILLSCTGEVAGLLQMVWRRWIGRIQWDIKESGSPEENALS